MLRMGRNPKEPGQGENPLDQSHPPAPPHGGSAPSFSPPPASTLGAAAANNNPGNDTRHLSGTQSATRAITESESLARDIKEGTLSGFVGSGTTLTGEAAFKGMLRIDGHLSGRVSSSGGTLIVSSGGQVDANVDVAVALINGTVNGDITASKRIELGRVAKVAGNIQTPALVIEHGAVFEGNCRMQHLKPQELKREIEAHAAADDNGASSVGEVKDGINSETKVNDSELAVASGQNASESSEPSVAAV